MREDIQETRRQLGEIIGLLCRQNRGSVLCERQFVKFRGRSNGSDKSIVNYFSVGTEYY